MKENIFALDIGTRTVTGILIEKERDSFHIIDYYNLEHQERSMRDGQIHDVHAVANIIKEVKVTLEERNGFTLHKVCIAAAGRALKTIEASASVDLREFPIKTQSVVKHLELSAVQAAHEKLASDKMKDSYSNYYCVGYSLLYYKLDKERIGSLLDQTGNEASAEIIATFLPKVVVESLLTAISKAGLSIEAMTLEPIAALHVLIPESMRRLNVVLVDIGAGTSDIAITDKGTVVAYGMVPIAGDEITEAISDQYLLDFPIAEAMKRKIVREGKAEVKDILGFKTEITYETLIQDIAEQINMLSKSIADEIHLLNAKVPRAVMLVGGGSLTPEITKKLAAQLGLPENRIAVRDVEAIQQMKQDDKRPSGPEFVTPIGIAITAKERPVQYVTVTVNEKNVRLFELNKLTIGDALVQAGYEINSMYGKPGMAAIITVNKKEITIPGEFGSAPKISLNGKEATVDTLVRNEDVITIRKGNEGMPAALTLAELIGEEKLIRVYYAGKIYNLGHTYRVNNEVKSANYVVKDKDNISWKKIERIHDFLRHHLSMEQTQTEFPITVNHKEIQLSSAKTKLLLNGEEVEVNSILRNEDELHIVPAVQPTVDDLFKELKISYYESVDITFNGKNVTLKRPSYSVLRGEEALHIESELHMKERLKIKEKPATSFIFQDVFAFVDLDLTNATGNFKLTCNDVKAGFDTIIGPGDRLAITWD